MSIIQKITRSAVALSIASVGFVGVAAASAVPAQAASCSTSVPAMWSVKNNTCSSARHFNIINNKTYKYAPWVGKARTSMQPVCWAGATHKGVQVRI